MISVYYKSIPKAILLMMMGIATPAYAQSQIQSQIGGINRPIGKTITIPHSEAFSDFNAFKPKQRTDKRRFDYQIWDDILQNIVIDFGPSSRIRASRPQQSTGTRVLSGHMSPYRLEGSRIAFSFLNDNYRDVLLQYRQDLVAIANQVDITRLSRDEQLAFWFNLHNVALIEKIAHEYPEDIPSTLQIDVNGSKALLDDAKFINIRGKALSLRNIREDIVFSNWSDPIVIYGFFRGDIGSPRMLRLAYTANNLEYRLNGNANEFVNSLRGFHKSKKTRKVSKIYHEVRRFYFKNWQKDIALHIKKYAEGITLKDFNTGKPFALDRYETKIADLSGGQRRVVGSSNLPAETARLLSEVGNKQKILKRRGTFTGLTRGYVTIEDIVTKPDQNSGVTIK